MLGHNMFRVARSAQSFGGGDQEALFQLVSSTSLSVIRVNKVELNFIIKLLGLCQFQEIV